MSGPGLGQKFRKTALKVIASSIRKGNILEVTASYMSC